MNTPIDWGRFASRWGYKDEVAMFTDLYHNENLSYAQLADRFDCSVGTVIIRMKALGIKPRPRGGARNPGYSRKRLWFLDQRVVYGMAMKKVVVVARVSQSVIYNYRHKMARGFDALLYHCSDRGSATLRNILRNASRVGTREEPEVSGVLPPTGEDGGTTNS